MTSSLLHDLAVRKVPAATRGLLFIGDPHLWSFKPGRRRDASFCETVLNKIRVAAEISNSRNLWPIFLGDLFNAPDDNDIAMLVALVQVLGLFDRRPVTLEGNHDKNELQLVKSNPLLLLRDTRQLDVISQSGGWAQLNLENEDGRSHLVVIGGSPYGSSIPTTFKAAFGAPRPANVDSSVWLTHEDLAFEGSYPGALPLQPIADVEMVINGHMHGTKLPVLVEQTAYYNPGNITRMSVDMAEHVPSVWEWCPFDNEGMASATGLKVPKLIQHVLPHVPAADAFDFEGRHTRGPATALVPTQVEETSQFVERMKLEPDSARTDDAAYARESLLFVLDDKQAPEEVRKIAFHLCEAALDKHQGRD